MLVYHGSFLDITKPDIYHSRKNVDFSAGFYVTTLPEQAEKWCARFIKQKKPAIISIYNLNETAFNKYKTLQFEEYPEDWLDFILICRRGQDVTDYDIVMGGVANDKVFNTVELFFDNLIDKTEALKRLRYEKPNFQIAFRTQAVIDECLHFERSKKL